VPFVPVPYFHPSARGPRADAPSVHERDERPELTYWPSTPSRSASGPTS